MKKVFAIILAAAIIATSLPLALISWAAAPDFDEIFANYEDVASKTYFDNNTAINTAGYVADYDNVGVYAAGLGTREANYLKALSVPGGSVTIKVDHDNAVETGLVVHKNKLASTYLTFYTSSDMQNWEKVSDNKIALREENCTTVAASPNSTDYTLRRQRIAGFPEGTRYLKVELTTADAWQPGLDYIDVFNPDRFEKVLSGYETTPSKTYFDTNLALNTEGYLAGYNSVTLAAAGLGYREGNYVKPDSTSGAFVAIEINSKNLVETGLVIANARLGDTSLSFYTSSDMLNWTPVSADNIVSEEIARDANYTVRKQRVFGFEAGARYLKIQINTTQTWQPGLDYIDVYALDRFDSVLDGFEETPSKIYFDDNTNLDAEGFVVAFSNLTRKASGLGTRDGNHVNANSNAGGYVVIELADTNAFETGLVVHKNKLNTSSLKFYTSSDMQEWTETTSENIVSSQNPCVTVNNPPNTTDYYLRRERVSEIPLGTRYLKVEIVTADAWQPGLDYIDVYNEIGSDVSSDESSSEDVSSEESSSEESSSEESSSEESSSEESSSEESSSEDTSSEDNSAQFDALTNGYEITKQLLSVEYKLDNAVFIGSTNWNFGKYGFKYRDEYSTQRPSNSNGDAEIILSVNDRNIVEIATIMGSGCIDYTTNTYYTSADGVNFTPVSAGNVYTKTLTSTDPVPEGYFSFSSGYVVKLERVINLPEGTTQLKIVTSTENRSGSWWQPGIEYIDLYDIEGMNDSSSEESSSEGSSSSESSSDDASSEVSSSETDRTEFNGLTKGYNLYKSLISAKETLDSRYVVSYKNWRFAKAGFNYRDEYSTQRFQNENGDAEIVLSVNENMIAEFATVISENWTDKTFNTYYVSADGENWIKISSVSMITCDSTDDKPEDYLGLKEGYIVRLERVTNLPAGTKQLKVVTSTSNINNSWWQPGIEYIDLYQKEGTGEEAEKENAKKQFYALTEGYEVTKTLITPKETLDSKSVIGYKSWRFAKAGLNFRDEYSTQRIQNVNEDAELIIKVSDDMIIEVATIISESRLKNSNNTYYVSTDGEKWKKISVEMIEIDSSEKLPEGYVGLSDGFIARLERVTALPKGTTQLKIVTSTNNEENSWWQPGIEYIDIYEKKGKAEEQIKLFDSLSDGYEIKSQLISATETLDSKAVLSYKNWRFAKAGLDYRDDYSTQRPNGVNEDAEIILKVTDDTITEVATVIAEDRLGKSNNTYYASADGVKWIKLSDNSVYLKELSYSTEKPLGYLGLKTGYIVRIERIVGLPYGTTQLKIVTSTGNEHNSWWQPGIEYIDIYEPSFESKLEGYELESELITSVSGLENKNIISYKNLVFTENGISFRDAASLKRDDLTKSAEIVVGVADNMPLGFGYTVFAEDYDKLKAQYFASENGKDWTLIDVQNIATRKVRSIIDSGLDSECAARIDLISALDGIVAVKAVYSLEDGNVFKDAEINYIKRYKEYINPFDTVISAYKVVETLLTPTKTIEAETILSYKGWKKFGLVGMPFFDEVGTQRLLNENDDAEIILSVDDTMAVEVATVIAKSLEGCTSNTYYASADGVTWTLIPKENVYEKRLVGADDNLLNDIHIGLLERIVGLPTGTTQLKIVTSTENKANSWWQPSINRITLYKDPFDSAVDGMEIVDKAEQKGGKLVGDRIVSYKNGEMILEVVDTMTVEFASENGGFKFFVSADKKNWVELPADSVHTRADGTYLIRISNMPEGVRFVKLVADSGADINYVYFYDKKVDKFDLAFVGMGVTESLFDATRKLNDKLIISYENWHYGKNGYSYTDDNTLQRDSENCSDANFVISVKDNQALEYGIIISNSWLKKTKTEYYLSTDGTNFTKYEPENILRRYISTEDDARIKEGYTVLKERLTDLPEGTAYIKFVVSTGNEKNSWWQPGIDYVDIYTPYENMNLEQIAAQTGSKDTTIEFTSHEDGLGNSYIFSSKNLESGKFGLSYSDEYAARRFGYNDSEIVLEVNEDAIIELATIIDNKLEYCAENKFYTSVDGELWTQFDSGMLLTSKVTEGVTNGSFALVQLLSELPADTKYVKIVGTTNGVTDAYKNFAYDYITIYKGESTFKIKNMLGTATVMLVGNFMNIQLAANQKLTVDELTDMVDVGKSLVYYYFADGTEVFDGTTEVVSGMKLVLKRNNKAKREFIISVTYTEAKDEPTVENPVEDKLNVILIVVAAVAAAAVIAGGVLLVIQIKRKKKAL